MTKINNLFSIAPMDYLDEALKRAGGPSAVIAKLGYRSTMTISQWRKRGIPAERVIPLSEMTGWEITPHMIDPSLYPHPEDGLPKDLRRVVAGMSTSEHENIHV